MLSLNNGKSIIALLHIEVLSPYTGEMKGPPFCH